MMVSENMSLAQPQSQDVASADSDAGRSSALPEEPLIKIRAAYGSRASDLKAVWAHRQLLGSLIWRDLKVRYKQTVLGASWVILQPLLLTIVFAVFLGRIVRVPSGDTPYPLFLYAGLLPWTFFSNAISTSSYSLIANAHIMTKVYFPRLLIPGAAVAVRLADFLVASLTLIMLLVYYGVPFTRSLLLAPLLVAQLALLALSLGLWFSALNVKYRDVGTVLPVLLQLWMFVSPIIYPASMVPQNFMWVYQLNPLVGIIENFRASLLNLDFAWGSLIISAVVTLILLAYSTYVFWRMEDEFADIV